MKPPRPVHVFPAASMSVVKTSQFHFLPSSPKLVGVRYHECIKYRENPLKIQIPPKLSFLEEKTHHFLMLFPPLLRKIRNGSVWWKELPATWKKVAKKKGSERLQYQKSFSCHGAITDRGSKTFGSDCFLVITACQKILFAS